MFTLLQRTRRILTNVSGAPYQSASNYNLLQNESTHQDDNRYETDSGQKVYVFGRRKMARHARPSLSVFTVGFSSYCIENVQFPFSRIVPLSDAMRRTAARSARFENSSAYYSPRHAAEGPRSYTYTPIVPNKGKMIIAIILAKFATNLERTNG